MALSSSLASVSASSIARRLRYLWMLVLLLFFIFSCSCSGVGITRVVEALRWRPLGPATASPSPVGLLGDDVALDLAGVVEPLGTIVIEPLGAGAVEPLGDVGGLLLALVLGVVAGDLGGWCVATGSLSAGAGGALGFYHSALQ
jgi:hypothetical protein